MGPENRRREQIPPIEKQLSAQSTIGFLRKATRADYRGVIERKDKQAQTTKAFDEMRWACTLDWLVPIGLPLVNSVATSAQTTQAESKHISRHKSSSDQYLDRISTGATFSLLDLGLDHVKECLSRRK